MLAIPLILICVQLYRNPEIDNIVKIIIGIAIIGSSFLGYFISAPVLIAAYLFLLYKGSKFPW